MAKIEFTPADMTEELIPDGMIEAEITKVEANYTAPWDPEDVGVNWRFRLTDENHPKWVGRPQSLFTTMTSGKNFQERFGQICKALGLESGFDTDELAGLQVVLQMGHYFSKKHQEDRNGINAVLSR